MDNTHEDWYAPESRQLPLLNGAHQDVEGTRLLWQTYENVMHYGAASYRDLLDAVWDEQDRSGCDFTTAFQVVIAQMDTDVRLWRDALIDAHIDSLTIAGRQFRKDFAEANN